MTTPSRETKTRCAVLIHFIFIQNNKISKESSQKKNLIVGCPSQRPKRVHHCTTLRKITAKNNGCPSTQSQSYDMFIAGKKQKPTEENTLSALFMVTQNVRAKRAESNQVLAKFALLAMAPQSLNTKNAREKMTTTKKKGKLVLILKTCSTTFKSTGVIWR